MESPSLRGSGLKFFRHRLPPPVVLVSLFTREWIEIVLLCSSTVWLPRLPLYEGVDWNKYPQSSASCHAASPSLRGSGLKSVDQFNDIFDPSLPLYEGVDWNWYFACYSGLSEMSPSLRGSGLKWYALYIPTESLIVSLFTREWIEILAEHRYHKTNCCLPLYEGVDWNSGAVMYTVFRAVSLFTREWIEMDKSAPPYQSIGVSLFTREWIEIESSGCF